MTLTSTTNPFVSIIAETPDVVRSVIFDANFAATPPVYLINNKAFPGP